MAQNIYDTPDFFANYAALARSVRGLDGAPEWPHVRALLPADLRGARVLDLACGFGWFSRWAVAEGGAASVRALDLSENMLARARAMTAAAEAEGTVGKGAITFERADLDAVRFGAEEAASFDLAHCSLALHYLVNLEALVAQVHAVLKPGGSFVFNVEHPILTAPSKAGWVKRDEAELEAAAKSASASAGGPPLSKTYWPLDSYQVEGERLTNWLADGVRKQHRTLTTYINILLRAGFELTGFDEWHPSPEELEASPEWATEMVRPTFLLVSARKR